jgi:hypothetical protein
MSNEEKAIREHYQKIITEHLTSEVTPVKTFTKTVLITEHRKAIRDLKTVLDTSWEKECLLAQKRGVIEGVRQSLEDMNAILGDTGHTAFSRICLEGYKDLIVKRLARLQADPDLVVKEENEK